MIRFQCEQCGKKLKAGPEQAGTRFKCAQCGTVGKVPRWTDEVRGEDADRAARAAAAAWQASTHDEEGGPVKFGGKRLRSDSEMDMTPMVDVTFQLLIFFMITASYSLQKAIDVPRPDSEQPVAQQRVPDQPKDDYVVLRVDQESVIWLNDREVPTRHELIARLKDELSAGRFGPQGLLVSNHPDARHDRVVMCIDVGTLLGIQEITLRESVEDTD